MPNIKTSKNIIKYSICVNNTNNKNIQKMIRLKIENLSKSRRLDNNSTINKYNLLITDFKIVFNYL